ncbi:cation diffusion facilitator family transporter [Clostridium transplantifaecale]|uniref:cation diffusion facilitator family transporter n=1 Tax=Clostridium transplantifaecale TaxID=2479838 RepID=UPI0013DDBE73|nr:cation diffusion facilitator family transporter [Clostridium transplantifaecale]
MISFLIKRWIKDSENISSPAVQRAYAKLCSSAGIFFNLLLFMIKLFTGLLSGSASITADGFNNLSDAASSVASYLGFCLAGIGAGENHPFGHGRYEWLMGFLSSAAVFMVGAALAGNSIAAIHSPTPVHFNFSIFFVLLCSVLIKFYMYSYNKKIGNRIGSSSMKAAAADCISDMVSTSAIIASLIVERLTGLHIDGWCGTLVSLFIMFSGLKSMGGVVQRLMGEAPDKNLEEKISSCVMRHPEVCKISNLLIHDYGMGRYAVSMHIGGADAALTEQTVQAEQAVQMSQIPQIEQWMQMEQRPHMEKKPQMDQIAQEITYELFSSLDCDATIQTEQLITDEAVIAPIRSSAEQVIKKFEETALIRELRLVNAGSHTSVFLTAACSRRLQKKEAAVRQALRDSICEGNDRYQIIPKLVIAPIGKKKN